MSVFLFCHLANTLLGLLGGCLYIYYVVDQNMKISHTWITHRPYFKYLNNELFKKEKTHWI